MEAAIKPVLTLREAEENSSFVFTEKAVYRSWMYEMASMRKAKPMPNAITTAQPAPGLRTCALEAAISV